jgi:hypothetical protein
MPEKNRHRLPLHSGAGIAEKANPAFVFNAISLRSVKWQSHGRMVLRNNSWGLFHSPSPLDA